MELNPYSCHNNKSLSDMDTATATAHTFAYHCSTATILNNI